MSDAVVLSLNALVRRFRSGAGQLLVLDGVDFEIRQGEIVGLVGPSGSGKSSLLHAAGLLEWPTSGDVTLSGVSAWELDDAGRTKLRRENIGFVYQFHHLLPEFTALENVALPALIAGHQRAAAHGEARRLLTALGLAARLDHRPSQLSGGEQQRVAIARALVNKPALILADEPTGNLDPDTSNAVFGALAELVRAERTAAIIATHNYELTRYMDRVVGLSHGTLVELDPSKAIEAQLAQAPRAAVASSAFAEAKPRLYPWARFWAKQIDLSIHVAVVGTSLLFMSAMLSAAFGASVSATTLVAVSYLATMLSFPLADALLVSRTGGSIGRALFRFSVLKRNGAKPNFSTALARSWTCLFFGLGLGLPIVWLFTAWASYSSLMQYSSSLWDRDAGTEVVHRGPRWWSWIVPSAYLILLGLLAFAWIRDLVSRLQGL